jgi:hypothetical protein
LEISRHCRGAAFGPVDHFVDLTGSHGLEEHALAVTEDDTRQLRDVLFQAVRHQRLTSAGAAAGAAGEAIVSGTASGQEEHEEQESYRAAPVSLASGHTRLTELENNPHSTPLLSPSLELHVCPTDVDGLGKVP